jgi:hypothetical protein
MKTLRLIFVFIILTAIVFPGNAAAVSAAAEYKNAPAMNKKLLVIEFNPKFPTRDNVDFYKYCFNIDGGSTKRSVEDAIKRLKNASHGVLNYTVTEYITLNEFVRLQKGYHFEPKTFPDIWDDVQAGKLPEDTLYLDEFDNWSGDYMFDFGYYIKTLDLLKRRNDGEFDEIWMFAEFPGLWETAMVGRGAYWINGPAFEADCKPFRINRINPDRLDMPMHNLGHSAESIMGNVFDSGDWANPDIKIKPDEMDTWQKFTMTEHKYPGAAAAGFVHYAPNSESDYDDCNENKV